MRMGADTKLPEAERRNYKGVFDCVSRIAREEGVKGLWRGADATVIRGLPIISITLTPPLSRPTFSFVSFSFLLFPFWLFLQEQCECISLWHPFLCACNADLLIFTSHG